ncbi:MAG: sulfite exporter TauE/SafE family protein, partial [Merismopedia sp. SIO2A8]|nr:sulfite exporter TauE/SafE family protein [Merismopedia sp. SIO2A8]
GFGIGALVLMAPLMATSFDWAQKRMGHYWRQLHLLSIPALGLVITHCLLVGTHYFGRVQFNWVNWLMITALTLSVITVILARSRSVWRLLSMEKWYVPPKK